MPNAAGEKCTTTTGLIDRTAYVRLLRFLPGGTLLESAYLSPSAVAGLGEVAGRVSRALAAFSHPGLDRVLQWDLRYGADVVRQLISHVEDRSLRDRLEAAASDAWSRIEPLADALPRQAVHLDLTDANVVVSRSNSGAAHPDGVIDFGDLTDSWAVSELAITVSSVLGHAGADPTSVLPAVRAFHAIRPLSDAEVDVLWPLLVLRTAVLIVSGAQQVVLDPDNDYLTDQSGGEERMFDDGDLRADGRDDRGDPGGSGHRRRTRAVSRSPARSVMVESASVVTLDLSTTSDAYDFGRWLEPGVEDELARAAVRDGAALVVTQYGQPRLNRAPKLSQDSPAVVPTGISMWSASEARLSAPWDGEVVDGVQPMASTFRGGGYELTLTGVRAAAAGSLRAGEPLAMRPRRAMGRAGHAAGRRACRRRCSRPRSWRPDGLR